MRLCVIGTGYVGLTTGVCLAARGHDVTALELRDDVIESLNRGEPHIHERGLPELLARQVAEGRFRACRASESEIAEHEIVMLAVGTPTTDGRIDLGHVREASGMVGRALRGHRNAPSIVVKSTVIPGTTDTFVRRYLELESGLKLGEFGLGMNPEFLREGQAVEDFMSPDRLVLGYEDAPTLARLEQLYAPWTCDRVRVNTRTAEFIKYANNCLLATQISAVNELANIAASIGGIDIMDVMSGVHLDERWNPVDDHGRRVRPEILTYLVPGCGFGGSCFPKDVQALRTAAVEHGTQPTLLDAVLEINARQPAEVATLLRRALGSLAGRRVLVLGLAFKPGTDDVRESTSLTIVRELADAGASVLAHDPVAEANARVALAGVSFRYVADWEVVIPAMDAIIVSTKWPEYERLLESPLHGRLGGKVLVDARRMFSPAAFPEVTYLAIGRRMLDG